ncbi:MAG: type II methionyl aminopeptidase [Promethearchaeota archaeon]
MTEDFKSIFDSYIKAGKAVIAAKKLAREISVPGTSYLEIAEKCEEKIINNGANLAFPINMSLNEQAAHYSPPIDDETVVPESGLLKIDLGSHVDGFIADSAFTINLDEAPKLQTYIDAANQALEAAISLFKPGTKLYELGEAIDQSIKKFGLNPIKNLGGHKLKQNNLHAGEFIPNYKATQHDEVLMPGDAYACEPFSTSGVGFVENGKISYIYRFEKKITKNMGYEEKNYVNKIEKVCSRLPFSPRLLLSKNVIPKSKIKNIINSFLRKGILEHYPILIERSKAPVAQQEHTIIIDMDGNTHVTTME